MIDKVNAYYECFQNDILGNHPWEVHIHKGRVLCFFFILNF